MMKRIVIYIFCFAITVQSMLGQFLLFDLTSKTIKVFPSIISLIVDNKQNDTGNLTILGKCENEKDGSYIDYTYKAPTKTNSNEWRFLRDTSLEHLFSPFSCQNEIELHSHIFSTYLYEGNFVNILAIEEKINNNIIFYSDFFRIIRIGLPITKIIYPFHSFY